MKIIYDNIIFSLQKAGGISIYWSEILKRLKINENYYFFEFENGNIFRNNLNIQTKLESRLPLAIVRYLPFFKKLPRHSIFHSSYYRISLQKDVINITTVYDFTYEYYRNGLAKYIHYWQKKFAVIHSEGIICISENTKKDLLKHFPFIDHSKIKVIYVGVGDEFFPIVNKNKFLDSDFKVLQKKKYILFIGDRSDYKNFDIAVKITKIMKEFFLVVVGGKDFNEDEKSSMGEISKRVFHYQGVSGENLNILYNNAFCLLYPSSYEGFGIPVVEAMKAGCPVVSTKLSSIPEVAGEAGLLVEEISESAFIEKINVLQDVRIRKSVIERGYEQAKKFSWNRCFEETMQYYQEVYVGKFK